MNPHVRAHIQFRSNEEAAKFVMEVNSDGTVNRYTLENFEVTSRVNARSLMGVLYAMIEYGEDIYLVNDTLDGHFPSFIDKYRVIN